MIMLIQNLLNPPKDFLMGISFADLNRAGGDWAWPRLGSPAFRPRQVTRPTTPFDRAPWVWWLCPVACIRLLRSALARLSHNKINKFLTSKIARPHIVTLAFHHVKCHHAAKLSAHGCQGAGRFALAARASLAGTAGALPASGAGLPCRIAGLAQASLRFKKRQQAAALQSACGAHCISHPGLNRLS